MWIQVYFCIFILLVYNFLNAKVYNPSDCLIAIDAFSLIVQMVSLLWLTWPKPTCSTLGRCVGCLQPFTRAHAASMSRSSPLISKTAKWSLALGHMTKPKLTWSASRKLWTWRITGRVESGPLWMLWVHTTPKNMTAVMKSTRISPISSSSVAFPFSIPSTSSSPAYSSPAWLCWSSTCPQTVGRRSHYVYLSSFPWLSSSCLLLRSFRPPLWSSHSLESICSSPWFL